MTQQMCRCIAAKTRALWSAPAERSDGGALASDWAMPRSQSGVGQRLRVHLTFWRSKSQTNRLTPHPGPLPFEGRGGAADAPRVSGLVSRVGGIGVRTVSEGAAAVKPSGASAATPSPLKGERAGVGENTLDLSRNKVEMRATLATAHSKFTGANRQAVDDPLSCSVTA